MRGALDRRVLAAVSHKVRHYCNAGRGRGRGAAPPAQSPLFPPAAPPPSSPASAVGLGHGSATKSGAPVAAGRGRGAGSAVNQHPVGENASQSSAQPSSSATTGRGRGESSSSVPSSTASSNAAKPVAVKTKKVVSTKKTTAAQHPPQPTEALADNHVGRIAAKEQAPISPSMSVHQQAPAGQSQASSTASSVYHPQVPAAEASAPQSSPAAASQYSGQSQATAAQASSSTASQPHLRAEASELFAALIQSCLARGLVHEIDYVYGAMQAAHIPATMRTCETLIGIYGQLGNGQKMDMMYAEIRESRTGQQKPEPPLQGKMQASETMTALINAWYSRGFLQEVDLAYRGMKACQLPISTQIYGVVMSSYNQLGNYAAMDMVYGEMRAAMTAVQPSPPQPPGVQPVNKAVGVPPPPTQGYGAGHGAPLPSSGLQQQYIGQPSYYPPSQMQQQTPVFQPGYAPPPPPPAMQQWPQTQVPYYAPQSSPYGNMHPGFPNMVVYHPQAQTYGYHPGYPPSYPGAVQYQPVQYASPNVPVPVPVRPPMPPVIQQAPAPLQAPAQQPQLQAKPPDQAHQRTRPKLELQPKALELLQQSEYSKLLKGAQDRAAAAQHVATGTMGHQPSAYQAQVHPQSLPQYPTGFVQPPLQPVPVVQQFTPSSVHARPVVQAPPPVHQLVRPGSVVRPIGQSVHPQVSAAKVTEAAPVKSEVKPQVPDAKPAAVKAGAKAQVSGPVKADVKPVSTKSEQVREPSKTEVKPAPTKPEATKPQVSGAKPKAAAETKAPLPKLDIKPRVSDAKPAAEKVASEAKPKAETKARVPELKPEESTSLESKTVSEQEPAPAKLKLGLRDKKQAAEASAKPEEPQAKVPTLKLRSATVEEDKGAAAVEEKPEERPKSPSLRLGLKKQLATPKTVEEPTKPAETTDAESSRKSDASELEGEAAVPALPSLRKKAARGRGKGGVTSMDPLGNILGVHEPFDPLLQQDDLNLEVSQDESPATLPALPFESRRGQGRGKALPVADPAIAAAEEKRLKAMREEAAARAIAILESGLGKSQMSVYLERRKKRLNDQQFTLGDVSFRRGAAEGRTGGIRKAKDSKQKAVQGEIDVDGAIEYIAPQEYMEKGDVLTDVEEVIKGTLHRHFLLDVDPELAMEEFGTNPDIDDKPLPTLEQTLEKAKEELLAQDGIDEKQWEEAVEDVKKRAPQLESLVQRYTGPKKQNAKQNNQELHDIVSKLPPFATPELTAFTKRAMITLQNNPDWSQKNKTRLLYRLVRDTTQVLQPSAGT